MHGETTSCNCKKDRSHFFTVKRIGREHFPDTYYQTVPVYYCIECLSEKYDHVETEPRKTYNPNRPDYVGSIWCEKINPPMYGKRAIQ